MPPVIVLDSHIWFWWINLEHGRFPSTWRAQIEETSRVAVSPVSCYELALAHHRGRLRLPCPPAQWFSEALKPAGIELLALSPSIAARAVALSDVHGDPFDRLIIATALEFGAKLASIDGILKRCPEVAGLLMA